ncbi:hypothetical protein RCNV-85A-027 [Raccoonpox virus]|uniref:Protein OPG050 n=1 Tax=Raccoon poxvirus TaxID=10256 RepID=A0A0G3FXK5_RACVI|nr:hypothetical protein ACG19_gp039 [Raccoonpox virus]AKJ93673.1 hypothetical protein RCNV-Herman-039 [Raccoonpox virus]AOP31304.1 hypothetical protein RCNV-85A-027 [Raccoonpox virus]
MSKFLTFVKNKIIDLIINNDRIKYSSVRTDEESANLLLVDSSYANHGFDCVEMINDIHNSDGDHNNYEPDSFL